MGEISLSQDLFCNAIREDLILVVEERERERRRERARQRESAQQRSGEREREREKGTMSHDMLLRAKTWRIIVNLSKRSPLFFAVFGGACTAGTYYLATATQKGTNPTDKDALFIEEDQLKRNAGLHAKVIARANKERLRVLLEEARDKKGDNERYKAALK